MGRAAEPCHTFLAYPLTHASASVAFTHVVSPIQSQGNRFGRYGRFGTGHRRSASRPFATTHQRPNVASSTAGGQTIPRRRRPALLATRWPTAKPARVAAPPKWQTRLGTSRRWSYEDARGNSGH
jgi:hypothetical protein